MELKNTAKYLADLVSMKSVTNRDNSSITDYIKSALENNHFYVELIKSSNGNNSIYAEIGPSNRPSVIFSGHYDVVPADAQSMHSGRWCYTQQPENLKNPPKEWSLDPHCCYEKDGKIFGRGTCDMLGAVATLLNFSNKIDANDLNCKIVFIITCDEETEMKAIQEILAKKFADKNAPDFPLGAIVMEPTEMRPVIAHRGVVAGQVTVKGKFSHVSRPDLMVDPLQPLLDILNYFKLSVSDYINSEEPDNLFIPANSQMTIYSLKTYEEGRNTPERAEFGYVFHYLPENYPAECIKKLDSYVRQQDFLIKKRDPASYVKHTIDFTLNGFATTEKSEFVEMVSQNVVSQTFQKVGFFTEAGHFQKNRIPVIVLGPGSILQAHVPDEYIEIEQLNQSISFLDKIYQSLLIR